MTAVATLLLVAAGLAGALVARRGSSGRAGVAMAAVPVVLVCAAAAVALAAPAAQGFGLAAVRVAAVTAAMAGGSVLVTAAFRLAGADAVPAPTEDGEDPSPLRGGLAIGVLERAAIAVCILANFSAGLAVIVAAKGLARYPELRNPAAAEQFIIGTFVSVLWACACAGVAVAIGR
ncbi:hypothetical protein [Tsukamurella sp. 1534]|uniref:hypothetical protein n=1 Tax=Tsukamurella sp. 1534 TaxID=1151061 RepID=UPI0002F47B55|nr:hypothetical protein [Tsukamurella sp. 1534]